jgi:ATP-binding cassette subfamily B protein
MEAEEMVDIIELTPDIVDTSSSKDVNVSTLKNIPSIILKDVSFKYPGGTTVFKNLDLIFEAGKSVGIVGTTGAGKTTLTNLLLRLREPEEGSIQIDGHDIVKDLTQDGLRKYISYVPQNVDLFHRSIFENVAYGKEGASRSDVKQAAQHACIHEFIETLSKGYDTVVGERGVMLSGGQRQRIAIARAILCDKPIVILDEATSSLDTITESEIQEMLAINFKNKTMIVIAHRLSTIRTVDRIIVLEDGRVVEDGTHEELVQAQGKYARLWSQQQNVEDVFSTEKTGFTGSDAESSIK